MDITRWELYANPDAGELAEYPCPCGCGEWFETGTGAIMHAINSSGAEHDDIRSRIDAYEGVLDSVVRNDGWA